MTNLTLKPRLLPGRVKQRAWGGGPFKLSSLQDSSSSNSKASQGSMGRLLHNDKVATKFRLAVFQS
jgi:hypothetical protein